MNSPEAAAAPLGGPPLLFILLGASNLSRGQGALCRFLRRRCRPQPVEVLSALGPGRGYHAAGGILNVVYPPLAECGWFPDARKAADAGARTVALVTDIGNDILYGASAGQILEAVDRVLASLEEVQAEVLISLLPSYFERPLHPLNFLLLRTLLYPRSQVRPKAVAETLRTVNRGLESRAGGRVHLLSAMDEWRGWDHVHYQWLGAAQAWTRIGHELLHLAGRQPGGRITLTEMLRSYRDNIRRWLLGEALRRRKAGKGFY